VAAHGAQQRGEGRCVGTQVLPALKMQQVWGSGGRDGALPRQAGRCTSPVGSTEHRQIAYTTSMSEVHAVERAGGQGWGVCVCVLGGCERRREVV
jgi:hypothetical protein